MSVTPSGYERFLARVESYAGLSDTVESELTARAVVAVLMDLLPASLRHDLQDELPGALLDPGASAQALHFQDEDAFFSEVANREHVPVGFAMEHVGVVCQALVDLLSAEVVQRIRLAVGDDLAQMFRHREQLARPQKKVRDTRRTISVGRPGGLHPLSEAAGDDNEDSIGRGRAGGMRPLSEARPGRSGERWK